MSATSKKDQNLTLRKNFLFYISYEVNSEHQLQIRKRLKNEQKL